MTPAFVFEEIGCGRFAIVGAMMPSNVRAIKCEMPGCSQGGLLDASWVAHFTDLSTVRACAFCAVNLVYEDRANRVQMEELSRLPR